MMQCDPRLLVALLVILFICAALMATSLYIEKRSHQVAQKYIEALKEAINQALEREAYLRDELSNIRAALRRPPKDRVDEAFRTLREFAESLPDDEDEENEA